MSEQNNIQKQIYEIDQMIFQIESGKIDISELANKYSELLNKAKNIEEELIKTENQIQILSEDFSRD